MSSAAIRTTGRHPGATARRKGIGALHPDRLTRAQLRFADHRLRRQFDLFDGLLEGRQHRQWKSQMGNRHLRYIAWGCAWLNQRRRNVKMSDSGRDSPGFDGIEKYEWRVVRHGIDLQTVVELWRAKSPLGPLFWPWNTREGRSARRACCIRGSADAATGKRTALTCQPFLRQRRDEYR